MYIGTVVTLTHDKACKWTTGYHYELLSLMEFHYLLGNLSLHFRILFYCVLVNVCQLVFICLNFVYLSTGALLNIADMGVNCMVFVVLLTWLGLLARMDNFFVCFVTVTVIA